MRRGAAPCSSVSMIARSGRASGTPVAAATSRATPKTLRKSGRFGSTSMSRTASSRPKPVLHVVAGCQALARSAPGSRRASRRGCSSLGEQSMPFDITPRSSRGASGSGRTGTREPGFRPGHQVAGCEVAHARAHDLLAGAVVHAGHAELVGVWVVAAPPARAPRPLPARPAHGRSTASTLTPCRVIRSASSSASRSVGANSRSQDRTTLTTTPSNCSQEPHVSVEEHPDVRDART